LEELERDERIRQVAEEPFEKRRELDGVVV
jgi:hypothetical protein